MIDGGARPSTAPVREPSLARSTAASSTSCSTRCRTSPLCARQHGRPDTRDHQGGVRTKVVEWPNIISAARRARIPAALRPLSQKAPADRIPRHNNVSGVRQGKYREGASPRTGVAGAYPPHGEESRAVKGREGTEIMWAPSSALTVA
jgi:hypothetical protein